MSLGNDPQYEGILRGRGAQSGGSVRQRQNSQNMKSIGRGLSDAFVLHQQSFPHMRSNDWRMVYEMATKWLRKNYEMVTKELRKDTKGYERIRKDTKELRKDTKGYERTTKKYERIRKFLSKIFVSLI